jgi:hypothetical protein
MDRNEAKPQQQLRAWTTPRLEFKGTVGDTLKTGGGKLSVSGGDTSEMRCQKGINPRPC